MALLIPSDVLFDLPDSSFLLETDKTMIPLLTLVELLNSFFKHPRKGQSGNLENYFPQKALPVNIQEKPNLRRQLSVG